MVERGVVKALLRRRVRWWGRVGRRGREGSSLWLEKVAWRRGGEGRRAGRGGEVRKVVRKERKVRITITTTTTRDSEVEAVSSEAVSAAAPPGTKGPL